MSTNAKMNINFHSSNNCVHCLTIWMVFSYKILLKVDKNFMKLQYKDNQILMMLDDHMSIWYLWTKTLAAYYCGTIHNYSHCFTIMVALFSLLLEPTYYAMQWCLSCWASMKDML